MVALLLAGLVCGFVTDAAHLHDLADLADNEECVQCSHLLKLDDCIPAGEPVSGPMCAFDLALPLAESVVIVRRALVHARGPPKRLI
ncbi:MAG: hypothetical protein CMQ24_01960 [Gammaproteobacteria bacterium]|nr:hypothetical protein [Gammaproteobacteria bacterium]